MQHTVHIIVKYLGDGKGDYETHFKVSPLIFAHYVWFSKMESGLLKNYDEAVWQEFLTLLRQHRLIRPWKYPWLYCIQTDPITEFRFVTYHAHEFIIQPYAPTTMEGMVFFLARRTGSTWCPMCTTFYTYRQLHTRNYYRSWEPEVHTHTALCCPLDHEVLMVAVRIG